MRRALAGGVADIPGIPEVTSTKTKKPGMNPRYVIYIVVLLGALGYFYLGGGGETAPNTQTTAETTEGGDPNAPKLARDFKTGENPDIPLGSPKQQLPGIEDPLLKKAEQDMKQLDWSNASLIKSEEFFKKGEREYLSKNYHRAIEDFQTSLALYNGHVLAERYLRRAIYEVEIRAKEEMAIAVRYFEALQYQRAIYHFGEVVALMRHRPKEAIVSEAQRYIDQSKRRLQAAELFP